MTFESLLTNDCISIHDSPRIIIQHVHELVMKRNLLDHIPDPALKNMQIISNMQIRTIANTDNLKLKLMTRFTAKANTTVDIAAAENIIVECAFCKKVIRPDTLRIQIPDNPPRINPMTG